MPDRINFEGGVPEGSEYLWSILSAELDAVGKAQNVLALQHVLIIEGVNSQKIKEKQTSTGFEEILSDYREWSRGRGSEESVAFDFSKVKDRLYVETDKVVNAAREKFRQLS